MKFKTLSALITANLLLSSMVFSADLKPGAITFTNIHGDPQAININTGASQSITVDTLLSEGYVITTEPDAYLDIQFANGVVARLSPNSKVEVQSFAVSSNLVNQAPNGAKLSSGTRTAATTPNLTLLLECGDIIVNAIEKKEGDLKVQTPISEVKSDLAKFLVSFGTNSGNDQWITRSVNLGALPVEVTTLSDEEFAEGQGPVAYIQHDPQGASQKKSLKGNDTAVVFSGRDNQNKIGCDNNHYTVFPFEPCLIERIGSLADHILTGAGDRKAYILITQTDGTATYFNIETGETGTLAAGMMLPDGVVLRSGSGSITGVFQNGSQVVVEPNSNVFVESISTQPVLAGPSVTEQTNIGLRVEGGKLIANTLNTQTFDKILVISPLDSHKILHDTVVSVEFLQVDANAFQTVSQNLTPAGGTGIATTVVSSNKLTYVSDTATFIQFSAEGNPFAFNTPPSFTHITESAVIPPTYQFIDRTIAFAAGTPVAPTAPGTPGNPGNILQNSTPDEDPVSQ